MSSWMRSRQRCISFFSTSPTIVGLLVAPGRPARDRVGELLDRAGVVPVVGRGRRGHLLQRARSHLRGGRHDGILLAGRRPFTVALAVIREPDRELHVGLAGVGRIGALPRRDAAPRSTASPRSRSPTPTRHARRAWPAAYGFGTAETAEALVDARRRRARDRDAHRTSRRRSSGSPPAPAFPPFCEKPVALELAAIDAVIDERRARRDPRPDRLPAALRRRATARRATRSHAGALGKLLVLRAATHDPSPPPEAYIATLRRHLPRPADPRLRRDPFRHGRGRSSRSTPTGPSARPSGSRGHDDVDAAVAVLRPERRRARDPVRDAPRPARLRRQARGLRDRPTASPSASTRARRSARSSPGATPAGATGYRDFIDRFAAGLPRRARRLRRHGARGRREPVLARATRAPRSRSRSPPTARAPSGDRSRSPRWLARTGLAVRESHVMLESTSQRKRGHG